MNKATLLNSEEMAPVAENKPQAAAIDSAEVLSNMMKFYRDGGRFCDVKIQIGDEVFELQRSFLAAISEYFDGMFRGNFEEDNRNYDEPIILREVDASAFREIMNSVLTGSLNINDSNIYPLLRAADFLQIRGGLIEVRCYTYIMSEYYKRPLPFTFDILSFACLTERENFIDIIIDHLLAQVDYFAKFDARFMEISFDIINKMLLRFRENLDDNEIDARVGNTLFCSIICWINHSRAARCHYRRDLMKNIDSSSISTDFALSLLNEHEIHVDEATNRGDNIEGWLTGAYNPRSMLGIKFAIGTTYELVAYDIRELTVQDNTYRIRDLEWILTVSHSSLTSEYLSIHAHFEGDRGTCDAEVSFTAVSRNKGVEDVVKTFSGIFVEKQKEGFAEFLRWKYIIDEEKGYIRNEDVFFQIRISF